MGLKNWKEEKERKGKKDREVIERKVKQEDGFSQNFSPLPILLPQSKWIPFFLLLFHSLSLQLSLFLSLLSHSRVLPLETKPFLWNMIVRSFVSNFFPSIFSLTIFFVSNFPLFEFLWGREFFYEKLTSKNLGIRKDESYEFLVVKKFYSKERGWIERDMKRMKE